MMHRNTKIAVAVCTLFLGVSITASVLLFREVELKKSELYENGLREAQASLDVKSLTALTSTLEDTAGDRTYVVSRILKEEDVVDFITLIETLGKEEGATLTIQAIAFSPINASFESLVIGVNIEGSYVSLMRLLTLFEHIPYQVSIGRVVLEKSGAEESGAWRSTYDIMVTKVKDHAN